MVTLGKVLRSHSGFLAALALVFRLSAGTAGAPKGSLAMLQAHPLGSPCSSISAGTPRWVSLQVNPPELAPGFTPPYMGFSVGRIVYDPGQADRIWAGTSYGLLRSDDGGNSWRLMLRDFGGGFAIDPRSPAIVFAAGNTILRSLDGGETWTSVWSLGTVRSFAFDPIDTSVIYAGKGWAYLGQGLTSPGAIYRSLDLGTTWIEPDPTFQPFDVHDLVVDPNSPATLIAATHEGIFRSVDRGGS